MVIPPKVKFFIWKVAQDIVAIEANLISHHVPTNPRCVLCGFHWSDTSYALFFCQVTKSSWKRTDWWHILKKFEGERAIDIIHLMKTTLNKEDFELFCCKIWDYGRTGVIGHTTPIFNRACYTTINGENGQIRSCMNIEKPRTG